MTKGRPTIPNEQKRLKGTLRPDRENPNQITVINPTHPPRAPETLNETGLNFWATAWATTWISQTTDYNHVLITAQTLDERDQIKAALAENPLDRTLRVTLRELDKQLHVSFSALGFTPSDRSRLGVAEVKVETKLENLLRRKAERLGSPGTNPESKSLE
jgi:hypothetical protein